MEIADEACGMSAERSAACVCPSRPCPVHSPGMTDLMVSPEAIKAAALDELLGNLEGLHVKDVLRLPRGMVRLRLGARGTDGGDVAVFFHELDVTDVPEDDRG